MSVELLPSSNSSENQKMKQLMMKIVLKVWKNDIKVVPGDLRALS